MNLTNFFLNFSSVFRFAAKGFNFQNLLENVLAFVDEMFQILSLVTNMINILRFFEDTRSN